MHSCGTITVRNKCMYEAGPIIIIIIMVIEKNITHQMKIT